MTSRTRDNTTADAGTAATPVTITGTTDQVNVARVNDAYTLSAPQSIATTSSPQFAGMKLNGLAAIRPVFTDASKNIVSTGAINNGQLMIGRTGFAPAIASLTGTTDRIWINNGAGAITISTPQDIATTSSPQFAGMTLNSLATTVSLALTTTGGTALFSRIDGVGTQMQNAAGNSYVRIDSGNKVSTAFVTLDDGFGTITGAQLQSNGLTASLPVKCNGTKTLISWLIDLTTEVTGVLPVANGGTGAIAFVNNRLLYSNAGAIAEASALDDGQVFIGRTGAAPIAATITGTALQIYVTTASGAITLSLPQAITPESFVTFLGMTLKSLSATSYLNLQSTGGLSTLSRTDGVGTSLTDVTGDGYIRVAGRSVSTYNNVLDNGVGGMSVSGILLPTTGGTPSSFNAYSELTHDTNWSGPFASIAGNIAISVIGKMVFLNFPQIVTTGNSTAASITASVALPAWLRPSNNVQTTCIINAASSDNLASIVSVLTSGIVTIRPTSFVNDTYAATSGSFNLPKQTCSYSLQ